MPNVLSGRFRSGSPRPLRTFAPGQCIPDSAIMQFMSMNIQRKKSAHHFRMQSEREQTLVLEKWLPLWGERAHSLKLFCMYDKRFEI